MATITARKKGHGCGESDSPIATVMHDSAIVLNELRGELRVDSRVLAEHLGNRHRNVFELVTDYAEDFEQLGLLRFQTGEIRGRGQPQRYVLLSEDQCYLLLTYSRNTAKVRALKVRLVKAFKEARENRAMIDSDYLPGYRALHDEVAALAKIARDAGSQTNERLFHMNANKLVNASAGIAAGMRGNLSGSQRLMLMNLQAITRDAMHSAIEAGADHKTAYREAKRAATTFAQVAGRLLGAA